MTYANFDENITRVHGCKISISDHYAIVGNRKLNNCVKSNTHQTITYRSFKNFDENRLISDMQDVPWTPLNILMISMKSLKFGTQCS